MRGFLREWFLHNLGLKVLALASATVLWALVGAEPELETTISVAVEFHNSPRHLEVNWERPESVHLQVQGPSTQVRALTRADVAVVLDLARVDQPGQRTFTLDRSQILLPRGIRLVRVMPAELRLEFEPRPAPGRPR